MSVSVLIDQFTFHGTVNAFQMPIFEGEYGKYVGIECAMRTMQALCK